MPEASNIPIPKNLRATGVKDMVRISDARMSGTAFGTIVLHVSPEAAVGNAQAFLQPGNRIRLSVHDKKMEFSVDGAELKRRQAPSFPTIVPPQEHRGCERLHAGEVTQTNEGCDFEMLRPSRMNDDPLECPAPGVQGPLERKQGPGNAWFANSRGDSVLCKSRTLRRESTRHRRKLAGCAAVSVPNSAVMSPGIEGMV